jgi:hypothetical protein
LYVWRTGYVGVTIKSAPLRLMITFIFDLRLLRRLKHNVSLGFFYRMKIGITFYFTVYSFHCQQFEDAYPFIWLKWNRRRWLIHWVCQMPLHMASVTGLGNVILLYSVVAGDSFEQSASETCLQYTVLCHT